MQRCNIRKNTISMVASILAAWMFGLFSAQAQEMPQYSDSVHLGVASCASSTCHGATQPVAKNVTIQQNEFITWQKYDKHAKAYEVLLNDASKRIAKNLGLKKPAHEAAICLDCHADNTTKRGATFQITDGVGCEACHAGGQSWLGVHISSAGHDANVKAGMYPTEDPTKRAQLCLSCHFGDKNKFVTHRIMGAGHPRMNFELDTFTAIQPAHFKVDDDYIDRKRVVSGAQTWAIGQALAVATIMDGLADSKRNHQGLFPELVFFDCYACHHRMSNIRWSGQSQVGLMPGMVRLNDANLIMLELLTGVFDESMGKDVRNKTRKLHAASQTSYGAMGAAAKDLKATATSAAAMLSSKTFDKATMLALFNAVKEAGIKGRYVDYAAAEQAAMALGAISDAMSQAGFVTEAQYAALSGQIAAVFKAVEKDEAYSRSQFRSALKGLQLASAQ